MKKTEAEFVNDGMSPEEIASLNDTGPGSDGSVSDGIVDAGTATEAPVQAQPVVDEPKMVDIRALQEARAAERSVREELAKFRTEKAAEQARLEERISLINQAMAAQNKPEPVQAPSKEEDPLGFYDHQFDNVNGKFQSLEQKLQAMEKAEQQRVEAINADNQRRAMIGEADAVINVAIAQNPQIQEAIDFAFQGIKNDIAAELERRNVPRGQWAQVGAQWQDNIIADMAAKCPRDPALAADFVMRNARFYGYGYQSQQATQQPIQPQPAQVQQPTIQQRAEQQERHMSLSGIQGGSAPVKLDAKQLATMSDDQFKELMKTAAGRKQMEDIMGGV